MDKCGAQKQTNMSQRNKWTNMAHKNRQICLRETNGQIWCTEIDKYVSEKETNTRYCGHTRGGCRSDKLPQVNFCPASKAKVKVIFLFLKNLLQSNDISLSLKTVSLLRY